MKRMKKSKGESNPEQAFLHVLHGKTPFESWFPFSPFIVLAHGIARTFMVSAFRGEMIPQSNS